MKKTSTPGSSLPPAGLIGQLTADKKKLSFILALGGVCLLLWGRLLLTSHGRMKSRPCRRRIAACSAR